MKRLFDALAIGIFGAAILLAMTDVAKAQQWGGFYAGLHGAYVTGDADYVPGGSNPGSGSIDIDGVEGGAYAGYNYQTGRVVLGIEVDGTWSGVDGKGSMSGVDWCGAFVCPSTSIASGWELYKALGRPEVRISPLGHYTSILVLPWATRNSIRFFERRFEGLPGGG